MLRSCCCCLFSFPLSITVTSGSLGDHYRRCGSDSQACSVEALRRLDNWALVSSPPSSTSPEPPSSRGCCALQTRACGKATQESYLIHRRISGSVCLHTTRTPACTCVFVCVGGGSFRTLSLGDFLFPSSRWSTFVQNPSHVMGPEASGAGVFQLCARTDLAKLDVV